MLQCYKESIWAAEINDQVRKQKSSNIPSRQRFNTL